MTSYQSVRDYADAMLAEYQREGEDPSLAYARLSGWLEMHIVTILDNVAAYHGDQARSDIMDRLGIPENLPAKRCHSSNNSVCLVRQT